MIGLLRRDSDPRGQALVEFALVILVVILLMVGILDFGRVVFASNNMSHAAREATRQASVSPLDCESIYYVVQHQTQASSDVTVTVEYRLPPSSSNPDPAWAPVVCPAAYDPSATYDFDPATPALGTAVDEVKIEGEVRVTVADEVPLATPLIANLVGDVFDVSGQSAMSVTFVPK
jgi:Flp pilus assembly protein TadG